jgi:hypothetical protein
MTFYFSHSDAQDLLRNDPGKWERRISSDLADEVKSLAGEGTTEIPELRRVLAVKGYREMKAYLERRVRDKQGDDAVRAIVFGMRDFAHERPGLSAATFRSAMTDCPEWRQAGGELGSFLCGILADIGIRGHRAEHALRIIRSLVRGFVIHEMQVSFLEPLDYEETFAMAVDVLVIGLKGLAEAGQALSPAAVEFAAKGAAN